VYQISARLKHAHVSYSDLRKASVRKTNEEFFPESLITGMAEEIFFKV